MLQHLCDVSDVTSGHLSASDTLMKSTEWLTVHVQSFLFA